jgi:hypothetical protein
MGHIKLSAAKYGGEDGVLYGHGCEHAKEMARQIMEHLGAMNQGDVLEIDLSEVRVLDTGFASTVYEQLIGGSISSPAHDWFCAKRAGKGIVFSHAEPHLKNLLAAVNEAKDVLVTVGDDLELKPAGRAFTGVVEGVYYAVRGLPEIDSTMLKRMIAEERLLVGSSLGNASNHLTSLHFWGLLTRRERVTERGSRAFVYTPIRLAGAKSDDGPAAGEGTQLSTG